MTRPAFTPGPWRACVWDPMERPHVHADGLDPTSRECKPHHDLPLTKADAYLMAAAPALYEVLRSFPGFTDDATIGDAWAEKMRAALALAEGDGE